MTALRNPTALALLTWLLAAGAARAHALSAECILRGGKVEVAAYFDDDTPARSARVRLEHARAQDGPVAQGLTDKDGRWSCPAPPPGPYVLVVDAGAGHLARVPMTIPASQETTHASSSSYSEDRKAAQKMPAALDSGVVIGESRSRREFTSIPWGRVFLGLGLLAAAGVGMWLWLLWRRSPADPADPRP